MADKKEKPKRSQGQMESGAVVKSSLDHYIGRPVDSVISTGGEDWEWAVKLEGGTLLKNHDKRRTAAPENLKGATFGHALYEEENTTVHFTNGLEVAFTPTLYSISDPRFTEELFPQVEAEEDEDTPIDPSPERVADGPSEEFLQAQKKTTAKKTTKRKRSK